MPFETVAETLLKGGIAPRHVRRYIGELCDHLEDGIAQQKAAGFDGEDARGRGWWWNQLDGRFGCRQR